MKSTNAKFTDSLWISLFCISTALLIIGAKFWLISNFASHTPYSDQWDAEAAFLYKPYMEGHLSSTHWLQSHNEHRIFTSRILALTLLKLNGIWNPQLQMAINAAIHSATLVLTVFLLSSTIGRKTFPVLSLFVIVSFGIPFGWQNTLVGFQSQFYILAFFSVSGLWLLCTRTPLSGPWFCGLASAFLSYLSMASGALTFAVSGISSLMIFALCRARSANQLVASLILFASFAACWHFTPALDPNSTLRASSLAELAGSLLEVWSWPLHGAGWIGLIIQAPAVFFLFRMVLIRPPQSDKSWFLFAFVGWCLAQEFAIAYGRSKYPILPRYTDIYLMGLLANLSCLFYFTQIVRKVFGLLAIGVWLALTATGYYHVAKDTLGSQLVSKWVSGRNHDAWVRAFVRQEGDEDPQENIDAVFPWEIPYPKLDRLKLLLRDQTIRDLLPQRIRAEMPVLATRPSQFERGPLYPNSLSWEGYAFRKNKAYDGSSARIEVEFSPKITAPMFVELYLAPGTSSTLVLSQFGQPIGYRAYDTFDPFWPQQVRAEITPGPLLITFTDNGHDLNTGFSDPTVSGRLDRVVSTLLKLHWSLIILGATLLPLSIILARKANTNIRAQT